MAEAADLILSGGTILTMEAAQPRAEAIAIAGRCIVAVGSTAEVMAHAGPQTRHVDLQGRTLLPGFIDAHGHFANALQVVGWANIQRPPAGPVTSIASLQQVLREHVASHPVAKGEWVIAYGYDVDGLSDGRPLDKADLDALFPDNPVMVIHNSNHGAVLNSRALAIAGYDASTPDPTGGVIVRLPGSTEPAGLVMETAFLPLFVHMPQPSEEERLAQQLHTLSQVAETITYRLLELEERMAAQELRLQAVQAEVQAEVGGAACLSDGAALRFDETEERLSQLESLLNGIDSAPESRHLQPLESIDGPFLEEPEQPFMDDQELDLGQLDLTA